LQVLLRVVHILQDLHRLLGLSTVDGEFQTAMRASQSAGCEQLDDCGRDKVTALWALHPWLLLVGLVIEHCLVSLMNGYCYMR
jgi:hypothetical protein